MPDNDGIPVSSGKGVKPKISVATNNTRRRANDSIQSKNESFKDSKSSKTPSEKPHKK